MDSKKTNFIGKCHCPECNCMYIIIDNEIISCPECEISSNQNKLDNYEEDAREELVHNQV